MAIEGSINESSERTKKSMELATTQNPFQSSDVLVAGKLKVKHPLMDQPMIILGFVIDDEYFNQDDFRIKGVEINYKEFDNNEYHANNDIVYPKMIIDKMTNHFSKYFRNDGEADTRKKFSLSTIKKIDDIYKENNHDYSGLKNYSGDGKFNYYLFSNFISDTPECATNESVYAVCKFFEDGKFKHVILNFHELIPDDNQ